MIWLFAAALFVSASLLFYVQPMIGKMLLPILGASKDFCGLSVRLR